MPSIRFANFMFTPSFHVIDFIFNIDYIVTPPTKMHKQKVH